MVRRQDGTLFFRKKTPHRGESDDRRMKEKRIGIPPQIRGLFKTSVFYGRQ